MVMRAGLDVQTGRSYPRRKGRWTNQEGRSRHDRKPGLLQVIGRHSAPSAILKEDGAVVIMAEKSKEEEHSPLILPQLVRRRTIYVVRRIKK